MPRTFSARDAASCIPLLHHSWHARIIDYKHRPADVIVGGCIGVLAAGGCRPRDIDALWLTPFTLPEWWRAMQEEGLDETPAHQSDV